VSASATLEPRRSVGQDTSAFALRPLSARPRRGDVFFGPFESIARSFAVEPIAAPAGDDAEIEGALASIGREPGGGLIVMPDAFMTVHRKKVIEQGNKRRSPVIYPYRY
jgi:hypothetical protein